MIQQTAPMTLLELVDRIKEKSNDTLLSTISANGGKAEIKSIAPLETAGHGDVAFLANSKYRDAAGACKATALVLTEEDKQAIWGEKRARTYRRHYPQSVRLVCICPANHLPAGAAGAGG